MEEFAISPSHQILQHTIEQELLLWETTANLMDIDEALENRKEPRKFSISQLPLFDILLRRSRNYIRYLFPNFRNRNQQ